MVNLGYFGLLYLVLLNLAVHLLFVFLIGVYAWFAIIIWLVACTLACCCGYWLCAFVFFGLGGLFIWLGMLWWFGLVWLL